MPMFCFCAELQRRDHSMLTAKELRRTLVPVTPKKKARAKSRVQRVPAADRARHSGFHVKLAAWLDANDEARRRGAVQYGPPSAERLAKVLTAQGEAVDPSTVQRWRDGRTLPESRYVPLLERLLGAPWSYLDDPKTTWPRRWTRESLTELLSLFPDERIDELVRAAEAGLSPPPEGSAKRR